MKNWDVRKLVMTAMLAGLAGALMSLEFPLPMMPPFYKVDFSTVPTIIAMFSMGPISAFMVEVIKLIVKVATVGTNSGYVGELANLLDACIFVFLTYFIYVKMGKTRKAVFVALASGVIIRTGWACFCNAFITLPLYAKAMNMPMDAIIKMVGGVTSNITSLTTYLAFATVPFNIIKIGANYIIGYILMDRLAAVRPSLKFVEVTE